MSELTEEHISNRNPDQEEVNSSNTQTFPGNIIHSNLPTIDKEHNTSLDESEEVEFFAEGFTESRKSTKKHSKSSYNRWTMRC